jgi:hypothetical protein
MDLRPGFRGKFKGNPQQGTLFHARASELDPTNSRMPRGYTPERQREVGEAMGEPRFSSFNAARMSSTEDTVRTESMLDLRYRGASESEKRDLGVGGARMRDAVARSTVTPEQVSRAKEFVVAPDLGPNGLWMPKDEQLLFGRSEKGVAEYREGFGSGNPLPEVQRLDQGSTVIHELGHANDPRLDPARGQTNNARQTMISQGSSLGSAEEFADDFAVEHFRPDPRAGRRETFESAVLTYPGINPAFEAPQHLGGYEKWGERSDAAVAAMKPRWRDAEDRGTHHPRTQRQQAHEMDLDMAAENRPTQMRLPRT